jgi:hypothetical protein
VVAVGVDGLVEGPRVKRRPLMTVIHARPMMGEMNRE